jgi:Sec-independent protein secretion pathway component TatC
MPRAHPDRMSFLEHLEELRVRLIRSLLALVVGFALSWGFRERIFHILTEPLRTAYPGIKFIYTGPSEALMLYMKMAFFVGIFVAAPFILYQVTRRPGPSPSSPWGRSSSWAGRPSGTPSSSPSPSASWASSAERT